MLTIRVALRALAKNKMRAGLTILGVVIGIAAVTTMVSIGQSASQMVQSQFELLGTNVIVVIPGSRRSGGVRRSGMPTLTARDAEAIRTECPSVLAVSPMVGTRRTSHLRQRQLESDRDVGCGTGLPDGPQLAAPLRRLLHRPRHQLRGQSLRHRPDPGRRAVPNDRSRWGRRSASRTFRSA